MENTFHSFSKLPAELRHCIWEMAVRPSGPKHPGVHFFSLQNRADHDGNDGRLVTTIPLFKEESKSPWKETEENPSTYFLDFGMWMACKESRTIVTEKVRRRYVHEERVPTHGFMRARYKQEEVAFGLMPHDDLICVRFSGPEPLEISHLRRDLNIQLHEPTHYFPEYMSIAFEHDVSWTFDPDEDDLLDMMSEPGPRGAFLTILDHIIWGDLRASLFLVEYEAGRKPDGGVGRTFYGNGFNFQSVHWRHAEVEHHAGRMNAWEFIDAVDECGEEWWAEEEDDRDDEHSDRECCGPLFAVTHINIAAAQHMSVLVCQEASHIS